MWWQASCKKIFVWLFFRFGGQSLLCPKISIWNIFGCKIDVLCFLFHDFVFRYSFTVELRVHCYFELVFNSPKWIHMIEVHSVSQIAFGTFRYENSTGYQIANSISKLYFRILKNIHQQCSTLADFFFLSFQM